MLTDLHSCIDHDELLHKAKNPYQGDILVDIAYVEPLYATHEAGYDYSDRVPERVKIHERNKKALDHSVG